MMERTFHILTRLPERLTRFRRNQSGAALVEFALALPLTLAIFGAIIESGRMFWTYQAAVAGVRDAARYVARVASTDSCDVSADFADYADRAEDIVTQTITDKNFFPNRMSITEVSPELLCIEGDFRIDPMPVAQVTAKLSLELPFGFLFDFTGSPFGTITTSVTDQSRVFGT